MLFVMALLFAPTANAECYLVNGEYVCVQSLGSQNYGVKSLSEIMREEQQQGQQSQLIQQQILIQQQQILLQQQKLNAQSFDVIKNSLASLSEIDQTTVINEIRMLPKAGQERFLGELVAGTEEQRQEIWDALAHPTEEGRAMRFKFYGQ